MTYRMTTVCSSATENREVVSDCRLLKVPPLPSEPDQVTFQVMVYVAVTWSSPGVNPRVTGVAVAVAETAPAETVRLTGCQVVGSVQNQVLALTKVYGCPFSFKTPFG